MQDTDTTAGSFGNGVLVEHDIGTVGVVATFIIRRARPEVAVDLFEAEVEERRTERLHG